MISILMPLYNGIQYLKESVNSILKQTFEDWELIIGINGHPKQSPVYQESCKFLSERIKVVEFNTRGKSNTLNEMVKICSFDIVCLLDVDDMWLPNKLFAQIPMIRRYDVVGTFCAYFGEKNDAPSLPSGIIAPEVFMQFNPIINSSSMFYKQDAKWNPNYHAEDYEMWLRLNFEGKIFYNMPEPLVLHRIHNDSFFNIKQSNLEEIRNFWRV